MPSLGWFDDIADANLYFTDQRPVTKAWDALSAAEQTVLIKYAYNRLYHSPLWNLPTYAMATPAELVVLKIINGEMGYYIAVHLADEDSRKGLQAQAVIKAGIVKEDYFAEWLDKLPVPANVEDLLKPWKTAKALMITDIDRDEDLCVDGDVVDCD